MNEQKKFFEETHHSSQHGIRHCKSKHYGVTSCRANSSHRKQLDINKLHANVTSDEFLQKTFSANKDKKDWLKN